MVLTWRILCFFFNASVHVYCFFCVVIFFGEKRLLTVPLTVGLIVGPRRSVTLHYLSLLHLYVLTLCGVWPILSSAVILQLKLCELTCIYDYFSGQLT